MIRGAEYERQARDTYITPREPILALFKASPPFRSILCDPCCGNGAMMRVFEELGYKALGFDISPWGNYWINDFLIETFPYWQLDKCDIITNPPYGPQGKLALAFIERALEIVKPWRGRVAMLLSIDFDSAKTRRHIFADSPIWHRKIVLLDRIKWFKNEAGSSNHAWYVWDYWHDPMKPPTIAYI